MPQHTSSEVMVGYNTFCHVYYFCLDLDNCEFRWSNINSCFGLGVTVLGVIVVFALADYIEENM